MKKLITRILQIQVEQGVYVLLSFNLKTWHTGCTLNSKHATVCIVYLYNTQYRLQCVYYTLYWLQGEYYAQNTGYRVYTIHNTGYRVLYTIHYTVYRVNTIHTIQATVCILYTIQTTAGEYYKHCMLQCVY